MKERVLSLAVIIAVTGTAFANEVALEPLTVMSTMISSSELNAPEPVEIYTQKDIEKAHVQTVYEFLTQQTSVMAMPSFGNTVTQRLDMRGYGVSNGYENIVVSVNGRRMNNIDGVPQLLSSIPPGSVERIEIIKSSGIVSGGDGANAGLINITTKKNNDKEIGFYGGTYGTFEGSFYAGHSDDRLSLSVQGEAYRTNGARHIDLEQNRDEQQLANGRFDAAYMPINSLELRVGAHFTRTDVWYGGPMTLQEYNDNPAQPGSGYGFGPAPTRQKYDSNAISAGLGYDISGQWSLDVDGAREKKKSTYVTYNSVANYTYDSARMELNYDNDALHVTFGGDFFDGERRASVDIDKRNTAGFIMGRYSVGGQTFKVGYRYEKVNYDNKSDFSEDESLQGAELGYNLQLDDTSSFFANYSRSFQTANIDRLFNYSTGAFTGYVDPMKAHNYNLGYSNISQRNKFKAAVYYIDLKNEIYYYADPSYVNSRNTNIDRSHKYGFDLYDQLIISQQWSVGLNYSFVRAVIDEEIQNGEDYAGNDLPGVPKHNVKATVTYFPNPFTAVSLSQVYRSDAYAANDFNNNFFQKQEAYRSTDLAVSFTGDCYEVFAKISNLFNQSNGVWISDDAIYPVNFTTTAIAGFKLKY